MTAETYGTRSIQTRPPLGVRVAAIEIIPTIARIDKPPILTPHLSSIETLGQLDRTKIMAILFEFLAIF